MKKLSEYKNEEALDLLADICDPVSDILADKDVAEALKAGKRIAAVSTAIKNHKPQILQLLARLDGVPIEEYHCNVLTLPMRLLDILNDEEVTKLLSA